MIYLDYAATTPVREEVVQTIQEALINSFGNPSSTYRIGKASKHQLTLARAELARILGVHESEIFFTSGATESNNWALRSQAEQAFKLGKGNHIVSSAIEHPSVMEVLEYLAMSGFDITYVQPTAEGEITTEAYLAATTDQTIGWVAMAVNNEVGSLLPIQALGELAKAKDIWFHVDTVQAIGHLAWDFSQISCTSFVGTGHKFYAPKGIGFLVYRPWSNDMRLQALLHGGGQEADKRSGTENLPYILGMVKGLTLLANEAADNLERHQALQAYFYAELSANGIAYEVNGHPDERVPYINNIWLKDCLASQLLIMMDLAGVYISAGSACSAGSLTESNVLKAYYPGQSDRWKQSLRISFGKDTMKADIDTFIKHIKQFVERK
ncbi:cysteine desulfurase family protein [Fundicoccus sp. Sow4_D5]|uniref:cysteine desulfurase family protein n=1 Tax=unclassified Fundicoccus TaxID=2761543 RepID=UPI003F939A04